MALLALLQFAFSVCSLLIGVVFWDGYRECRYNPELAKKHHKRKFFWIAINCFASALTGAFVAGQFLTMFAIGR